MKIHSFVMCGYLVLFFFTMFTLDVTLFFILLPHLTATGLLMLYVWPVLIGGLIVFLNRPLTWGLRSVQRGRNRTGGMGHTSLKLAAGILLMIPGILSGLTGIALLLPAVRSWLSRRVVHFIKHRIPTQFFDFFGMGISPGNARNKPGGPGGSTERDDRAAPEPVTTIDVEARVYDVDAPANPDVHSDTRDEAG